MRPQKTIKIGIALAVILLFFLFWKLGLNNYLTIEYLKETKDAIIATYLERPMTVTFAYMGIYIAATALSVPGAVILTLAGAAIFGLVKGTIIISFASTIGATIACFVARFLFRDWVKAKLGRHLAKIDQGLKSEGILYLFTLRLVPIFPFWMINLAMGLTNIPLRTFYWVSQLGMLPGTIVYVNAGTELGKIKSAGDIMSPRVLLAFALLGLFPFMARWIVKLIREKRRYSQ